jgi:RNA polymerase sigma factor (sigma-70 family)
MNLSEFPESSLTPEDEIAAATSGTEEAKLSLVMHSMREAFLYAFKCSRGNLEEGEVLSACYLALVDATKNFNPHHSRGLRFFAYAKPFIRGRTIAEFRAKDVVRRARDHESLQVFEDSDVYGPNEAAYSEPEITHSKEEWESLAPLIKKCLNEREAAILDMYYKGGLNFRQIGDLLGVSRSHTQNDHRTALKKIRIYLLEQKRLFNR